MRQLFRRKHAYVWWYRDCWQADRVGTWEVFGSFACLRNENESSTEFLNWVICDLVPRWP